jgi:transcriptional regulator with XRE-family HTH domain
MSFADRLLEAFNGASMADIARRLDLPHSTVRNYIQNKRLPAADVLIAIANNTNVSLHWLLTGKGDKSAHSAKLGNLGGRLDESDLNSIGQLREEWEQRHGQPISMDDFIRTLVIWGEQGIRGRNFSEDLKTEFGSLEYSVNINDVVARSIIELIRKSIEGGDLTDSIRRAVKLEPKAQDLGTVDQFDIAGAIEKYDNPLLVLQDWFEHDHVTIELPQTLAFQGWETMTLEEKVREIKGAREIMEHNRYFQERQREASHRTKRS